MAEQRMTDEIRAYVKRAFIEPARSSGRSSFSVRVKDVRSEFAKTESMRGRSATICQALKSRKLRESNGLEIESVDGPPSKQSPTVVVHYRFTSSPTKDDASSSAVPEEAPEQWANRLGGRLRGLLKEEIASYGGGEAFIRSMRTDIENGR